MNKKQLEKTIVAITTIRENVRDNLYDIESVLETAQSEIDEAIHLKTMAEDSMSELDDIIDTFKIVVENGGIK